MLTAPLGVALAWVARRPYRWSVFVGVLIEIGLRLAGGTPPITWARNWALDSAMYYRAEGSETRDLLVPPLALIDVDAETWRDSQWDGGEPAHASRIGLLKLIRFALERGARYVIVDIAIEDKAEGDEKFARGIAALTGDLDKRDQYLLFVRTLRQPLQTHPRLSPEWRSSALDELRASKRILAVAPYFKVSSDGVTRDWILWQGGCRRSANEPRGEWQVLPSAQIVVAALQLAPHLQHAAIPWGKARAEEPCIVSADALPAGDLKTTAELASETNDELWRWLSTQTKLQGYPELVDGGEHEPEWFRSRMFLTLAFPPRADRAVRLSALDVLDANPRAAAVSFADGVVVIGQSFEEARDSYLTPLGAMPGSFLLLNSVASILVPGLLRPVPVVLEIALSMFMILAVSWLFVQLGTFGGTLAITLTLVPLQIILSDQLGRLGYWSDFGVPLLGIALDKIREAIFGLAREDVHFWRERQPSPIACAEISKGTEAVPVKEAVVAEDTLAEYK